MRRNAAVGQIRENKGENKKGVRHCRTPFLRLAPAGAVEGEREGECVLLSEQRSTDTNISQSAFQPSRRLGHFAFFLAAAFFFGAAFFLAAAFLAMATFLSVADRSLKPIKQLNERSVNHYFFKSTHFVSATRRDSLEDARNRVARSDRRVTHPATLAHRFRRSAHSKMARRNLRGKRRARKDATLSARQTA